MMKKKLLGFSLLLMVVMVMAFNVSGAGNEGTRSYKNKNFTAISVASGLKLEVKQGEKYEVTIRTKKSQLDLVEVDQLGKKIMFYLPPLTFITAPIEIFITMPELTKLDLSGGSTADIAMKVPDKTFDMGTSGGAVLNGSLEAQRLEMDLSGGSQSHLTGEADSLRVNGSGGSQVRQESFQVNKARFSLSGGSTVYISVNELMDVDASGGAQVYYHGSPKLGRTSFSGGAGIHSLD